MGGRERERDEEGKERGEIRKPKDGKKTDYKGKCMCKGKLRMGKGGEEEFFFCGSNGN